MAGVDAERVDAEPGDAALDEQLRGVAGEAREREVGVAEVAARDPASRRPSQCGRARRCPDRWRRPAPRARGSGPRRSWPPGRRRRGTDVELDGGADERADLDRIDLRAMARKVGGGVEVRAGMLGYFELSGVAGRRCRSRNRRRDGTGASPARAPSPVRAAGSGRRACSAASSRARSVIPLRLTILRRALRRRAFAAADLEVAARALQRRVAPFHSRAAAPAGLLVRLWPRHSSGGRNGDGVGDVVVGHERESVDVSPDDGHRVTDVPSLQERGSVT